MTKEKMSKILPFVYCYKLSVELRIEYKVWKTRRIIVNHHAKSNIFFVETLNVA